MDMKKAACHSCLNHYEILNGQEKTTFPEVGGLMGESAAKLISFFIMNHLQAAPFRKGNLYFLGGILFDSFMPKGSILRRVVKIREKNRL